MGGVQGSIGLTTPTVESGADMAKGKNKPTKQTKKPKSDKPKGSGSSYQQEKASGKKG